MLCAELFPALTLTEQVEYSDYGYWVTPSGAALVVPDSRHGQVLQHHYQGAANFGQDRYGEVLREGWVWVNISGGFLCFLDPDTVTRPAIATLLRIIATYQDDDWHNYRIVLTKDAEHVGSAKHDFVDAKQTRDYLRSLLR